MSVSLTHVSNKICRGSVFHWATHKQLDVNKQLNLHVQQIFEHLDHFEIQGDENDNLLQYRDLSTKPTIWIYHLLLKRLQTATIDGHQLRL